MKDFIECIKKIYKFKAIFKVIAALISVGITVYNLIPKYDKIKGIDTDALVMSHIAKT